MRFSIISICKNDINRLIETIGSVRMQSYTDYEYIIQDGLSIDGTSEAIKGYKNADNRIKYYSEKDDGIYYAMNLAIDKAEGDYIIFLNAGDYFASNDVLARVNKEINNNPNGGIYYGNAIIVLPDKTEKYQQIAPEVDKLTSAETLDSGNLCLIHQAVFAKREVLKKYKFNCVYKLRAELEWYYHCIKSGVKLVKIPLPICLYSLGGISESIKGTSLSIEETTTIIERYGYNSQKFIEALAKSQFSKGIYKYIYSQWLSLESSKVSMEDYFKQKGIHTVAIFGYGELGCHIYHKLKHSSIIVDYFIESQERYSYEGVQVFKPCEYLKMRKVDIIIVTAIIRFDEVYRDYGHLFNSPMISFEHIIEDMWNRVK